MVLRGHVRGGDACWNVGALMSDQNKPMSLGELLGEFGSISRTLGVASGLAGGGASAPAAPVPAAIETTAEVIDEPIGHVPDRALESTLSRWLRTPGVFIVTTHDGTAFHATGWAVRVPVADGTAIESERAARDALAAKLLEMGEVTP